MTPELLRQWAQRCRDLHAKAIAPEVKEQLGVWAVEFEAFAEAAEKHGVLSEAADRAVLDALNTMSLTNRRKN